MKRSGNNYFDYASIVTAQRKIENRARDYDKVYRTIEYFKLSSMVLLSSVQKYAFRIKNGLVETNQYRQLPKKHSNAIIEALTRTGQNGFRQDKETTLRLCEFLLPGLAFEYYENGASFYSELAIAFDQEMKPLHDKMEEQLDSGLAGRRYASICKDIFLTHTYAEIAIAMHKTFNILLKNTYDLNTEFDLGALMTSIQAQCLTLLKVLGKDITYTPQKDTIYRETADRIKLKVCSEEMTSLIDRTEVFANRKYIEYYLAYLYMNQDKSIPVSHTILSTLYIKFHSFDTVREFLMELKQLPVPEDLKEDIIDLAEEMPSFHGPLMDEFRKLAINRTSRDCENETEMLQIEQLVQEAEENGGFIAEGTLRQLVKEYGSASKVRSLIEQLDCFAEPTLKIFDSMEF